MNHLIHVSTASIIGFLCFLFGLLLMGILKEERNIRLERKLGVSHDQRSELKAMLAAEKLAYADLERQHDARGCEVSQLRAALMKARPLKVLRDEEPGGAA